MNLAIAGAGMAGLVAAARARELGAVVSVTEKGNRPGGSMLLSSCVVWRHTTFEGFREDCPDGDPALQRLIWERFDDALGWLEHLGPTAEWSDTRNPRTTGRRFDPRSLTDVLVDAAGEIEYGSSELGLDEPLLLATGGFPVRLARELSLPVRSNPWSEGDGLAFATSLGAATAGDLGEFYGRAMPAPPARYGEDDYVRLAQLYGGAARAVNERGEEFFDGAPAWHENDLAQAIARQPGGTAWFVLDEIDHSKVVAARDAGGDVVREDGSVRVHVTTGVTHTLGGLRIDEQTRVLRADGSPIDGLYTAGVDAGGIASGGYSSGLAQALVLGLVAAESIVS
jgi:succinate dehydrogenase/fumarate reductase flavoprotein subunit